MTLGCLERVLTTLRLGKGFRHAIGEVLNTCFSLLPFCGVHETRDGLSVEWHQLLGVSALGLRDV